MKRPSPTAQRPTSQRQKRRRLTRRGLRFQTLESRQLLAADLLAPEPHAFVNLYDYDGQLLSNWRDLAAQAHAGEADHDHESHDHESHDHDDDQLAHLDELFAQQLNGPPAPENSTQYQWPQPGGPGSPVTVSYSYSNLLDGDLGGSLTSSQLRQGVEEALGVWANYAPLHFVELADAGPPVSDDTSYLAAGTPDIRIGHHDFDGASGTLAHAYYPTTYWGIAGDVHMDSDEQWRIGAGPGIDFVEVMVHEVGHALGLDHEPMNVAIMNPFYGGRYDGFGTSFLYADDISAIRSQYGTGIGSVSPLSTNTAPVLAPVGDLSMPVTTDSIEVTLMGSDAEADPLTYGATLVEDPSNPDAAGPGDVSLTVVGNQLTIDPADQFVGEITISASVTDGEATVSQLLNVTVENNAPVIDPIATQHVSHLIDSLTVSVDAVDPEGSDVQLSAEAVVVDRVAATAHQLQQTHSFHAAATDAYNFRGHSERYFYGEGTQWFYILPEGEIFRWQGSIAASTPVAQLDETYHADLNRLFQAQAATPVTADVSLSWSGNDLTMSRNDSGLESFDVIVTASDTIASSWTSFAVNFVNHAPAIAAISGQQMSHLQDSITVAITATDLDGEALSYSATAYEIDSQAVAAYQLDSQFGFHAAGSDSYNFRGFGEKYFYGLGSQWFYILGDGSVFQWGGSIAASTAVGQLDPSYHADLGSLTDAVEPVATPADVILSWSGNDLTIDPADGFTGSFDVTVTAADSQDSSHATFSVSVQNGAPEIGQLDDLVVSHNAGPLTVAVPVTESDGEPLTFSATAFEFDEVQARAYQWMQEHGFRPAQSDSYNFRGLSERYFHNHAGQWFYMLPDGEVYRWGGSIAASTSIGTLSSDYHNDLNLLFGASQPAPVPVDAVLSWSGNVLTIDPPAGLIGSFDLAVTVSDGAESDAAGFQVTITNSAPVISDIADQQVSYTLDSISLAIAASDADGDDLSYSAVAVGIDALQQHAYELSQQYSLYSAGSDSYNFRGHQERYFKGLDSQWFYMLPDGAVYRWGGSIAASIQVGQLDSSYHGDLNRLLQASEPEPTSVDVTLSWDGSELTIDPADGFTGSFDVEVTVSDAVGSDQTHFHVDVANLAPTLSEIPVQTITGDSITVAVDADDPDGDAVSLSAVALQIDPVGQLASDLLAAHQFHGAPGGDAFNFRGLGERYFHGDGSQWYYILPDGQIYRWGGSIAASTFVEQLDATYHADLTRLFTAQQPELIPLAVGLDWNGNDLTITPPSDFAGSFQIRVDVSAGGASASRTFDVNVPGDLLVQDVHARALEEVLDELANVI